LEFSYSSEKLKQLFRNSSARSSSTSTLRKRLKISLNGEPIIFKKTENLDPVINISRVIPRKLIKKKKESIDQALFAREIASNSVQRHYE
jgi:hypothetical protein